jgi:DNA-binding HxlR family transcriptional regulator
MTKVEEYANQIPLILRKTFKAFASDNRSAIVIALHKNNKRLTFTQLKRTLNIDQRILTDELKRLMSGAIVDHYTEFNEGVRGYSYYELTDYGINILKATLNVLSKSYEPVVKLGITTEISQPIAGVKQNDFIKKSNVFLDSSSGENLTGGAVA